MAHSINREYNTVPDSRAELKSYSSPRINYLTSQQAKALFIAHANTGDQGIGDVMDMLFPDPNNCEKVSSCIEGERPGGLATNKRSRASRLFMSVWISIKKLYHSLWVVSIKGRFYRFLAN